MKERLFFGSRTSGRRVRAIALLLTALTFLSLLASTRLELLTQSSRLSRIAAERTALRLSTASDASQTLSETLDAPVTSNEPAARQNAAKSARDAFLATTARKRFGDAPHDAALRRAALLGLARWDVAPEYAAPFMIAPDDRTLYETAPRANLLESRANDLQSSRDAADAIAELAEKETAPELDAAISFLRELGSDDAPSSPDSALETAFLWTAPSEYGDPIDGAAYVLPSDFAPASEAVLAARVFDASSRLFLLLALGVLPLGAFAGWASVVITLVMTLAIGLARVERRDGPRGNANVFLRRNAHLFLLESVRLLI